MAMTVDMLCEEIMSKWDIPLARRLELVRKVREKAAMGTPISKIVKSLAGIYMGNKWAKSTGANRLVGAYLGYLISKKL